MTPCSCGWRQVAVAACLLLSLSLSVLRVDAAASATSDVVLESALSTHVANVTLVGASNGWPETTEALAALTATVTSTICGRLPSTVDACSAFLMSVSSGVVGLQVSAQTGTAAAASATYQTLYGWSNNVDPPLEALRVNCAQALGVGALDPLTYRSGQYLMPCRNSEVYQFLPVCRSNEAPATVVYVGNATGSTSLQSYFESKLCGTGADCGGVSIVVSTLPGQSEYSVVNITGAAAALEAVLLYVADVRAAYQQSLATANPGIILNTGPGDASAGVSATLVQMRYDGMMAPLFSSNENVRYDEGYPITVSCDTNTGLWALALLALLPILMITYLWVRHRGRRRSKKHQRKLIIEDEMRIMQGYTNPGGADDGAGDGGGMADMTGGFAAADMNLPAAYGADGGGYGAGAFPGGSAADPPPGTDYQRTLTQDAQMTGDGDGAGGTVWMMDADGNYYEMPAADYDGAADQETPQQAEEGDGSEYNDDPGNQAELAEQQADAAAGGLEGADPNAAAGEEAYDGANTGYQTYVDPNTGEVYQYEYEQAPDETGAAGTATADDGYGEEDANAANAEGGEQGEMQTYIDPDTGEAYMYDPNATAGADTGEGGDGGLQTYVDPNTGEVYQYDPNAVEE